MYDLETIVRMNKEHHDKYVEKQKKEIAEMVKEEVAKYIKNMEKEDANRDK